MQSNYKLQSAWIILLDLGCLLISIFLALLLRFGWGGLSVYIFERLDGWVLFVGSLLIANFVAGTYQAQYTLSRFNMLVTWIFSILFAVMILSITSYAWLRILLGRGVLVLAAAIYSALSLYMRLIVVQAIFSAGHIFKNVAIIGHAPADRRLRDYLENPFIIPQHRVVAWVLLQDPLRRLPARGGVLVDGLPVIEATPDELLDVGQSLALDLLVLGRAASVDLPLLHPLLRRIRFSGIAVMLPLNVIELFCGRLSLALLDQHEVSRLGMETGSPFPFRVKRIADLSAAVVGGLLALPVMIVAALLIKLTDPRAPIFYTQSRVGQFGRHFNIRKFRTMRPNAEAQSGAVWSGDNDPRITGVGRLLRKYRIDELPQLWNVLKGEMSLVGPRPERPEITAMLAQHIPLYHEREHVLPGISGWAQINYPYGNTIEAARRKLEYDLYYVKHLSLSLDLMIILRTVRIVLFGKERNA